MHADAYESQLDFQAMAVRRVLHALGDDDHEQLAELGIDLSYAWLDDLLMAATTGAPVVGIETVGPYAAHHLTPDGLAVQKGKLPADERIGLQLAGIFRDVFADCQNVRGVALLDDLTINIPGRELTSTRMSTSPATTAPGFCPRIAASSTSSPTS